MLPLPLPSSSQTTQLRKRSSSTVTLGLNVSTRWLSDREKAIAVLRLQRDTGVKDEETTTLLKSFGMAAKDYKLWLLALVIITKTTAGAVTQFIPTVVNTFGMSKVTT